MERQHVSHASINLIEYDGTFSASSPHERHLPGPHGAHCARWPRLDVADASTPRP